MTQTELPFEIFNVYVEVEEDIKEKLDEDSYACHNCLGQSKFDIEPIKGLSGSLLTCTDCGTLSVGIPESVLGDDNAKELRKYNSLHAEWAY